MRLRRPKRGVCFVPCRPSPPRGASLAAAARRRLLTRIYPTMTDREYFTQTTCGEGLSKEAEAYISKIAPNYAKNMSAAIVEAIGGNGKRLNILRSLRLTKAPHLDGLNRVDAEIPSGAFKIRARLYIPNSRSEARIPALLYLHGGGWTIGAIESCELFCQKFALEAECAVCAIDYRLAPEHKHPAAEEDSLAAFEWILENAERFGINPDCVFAGGDSAGGHLSAAVADARIKAGKNPPRGLLMYYPVTAMNDCCNDESYKLYARGYALDALLMDAFYDAYIPRDQRRGASPENYSTLPQFPPTLILTSGFDILRDQGRRFADKLAQAGAKTRRVELAGATHIYLTMPGMEEAFNRALGEGAQFLKRVSQTK